jgi:dihydrodipicolinate synthase/N-acetylneuraminate lyase
VIIATVFEAFKRGDTAEAQKAQVALVKTPPDELSHKPAISFYKEAVTQLGLKVGPPRNPTTLLNDEERKFVTKLLHELGMDKLKVNMVRKMA